MAVKRMLLMSCGVVLMGRAALAQEACAKKEAPKEAEGCGSLAAVQGKLDQDEKILQDWAQVNRYREANAKLGVPPANEERVVFMGDSITDMWALPKFGGFFPGKPYVDRGIGGQTTPQMLIRFRPDVLALQARVVVILAGTNDIAGNTGPMTLEETEGNLASMTELAEAHGIHVVLSSVMPVSDAVTDAEEKHFVQTEKRPPEKILALNEWIKKYAATKGYVYLDYYAATVDEKGFLKTELTFDGLHPNAAGYAVMTPLAEKAIQETLRKK